MPMLNTQSLTFAYNTDNRFAFPDIQCEPKAHTLVLGQSGTGKTTFLHLLAGLLSPESGNITIANQDITQLSTSERDRFRGKHIGIIFQQSHFISALTAEENLLMAPWLIGQKQDRKRTIELLERLGIGHKAYAKPQHMSQGEQQRLAIARALMNRPSLILADEPTASLDDKNCKRVLELLTEQADAAQATLLIVTHDQRLRDHFPNFIAL